jgi:hypothetical protein
MMYRSINFFIVIIVIIVVISIIIISCCLLFVIDLDVIVESIITVTVPSFR